MASKDKSIYHIKMFALRKFFPVGVLLQFKKVTIVTNSSKYESWIISSSNREILRSLLWMCDVIFCLGEENFFLLLFWFLYATNWSVFCFFKIVDNISTAASQIFMSATLPFYWCIFATLYTFVIFQPLRQLIIGIKCIENVMGLFFYQFHTVFEKKSYLDCADELLNRAMNHALLADFGLLLRSLAFISLTRKFSHTRIFI